MVMMTEISKGSALLLRNREKVYVEEISYIPTFSYPYQITVVDSKGRESVLSYNMQGYYNNGGTSEFDVIDILNERFGIQPLSIITAEGFGDM